MKLRGQDGEEVGVDVWAKGMGKSIDDVARTLEGVRDEVESLGTSSDQIHKEAFLMFGGKKSLKNIRKAYDRTEEISKEIHKQQLDKLERGYDQPALKKAIDLFGKDNGTHSS